MMIQIELSAQPMTPFVSLSSHIRAIVKGDLPMQFVKNFPPYEHRSLHGADNLLDQIADGVSCQMESKFSHGLATDRRFLDP
jgi:hypothetical protein